MEVNMVYMSLVLTLVIKLFVGDVKSVNIRSSTWRMPSMARQKLEMMGKLEAFMNYLEKSQKRDTAKLTERSESSITQKLCIPRSILASTYTHDRGVQIPRAVHVKRCQGGIENPENYQCQPTKVIVECFRTTNFENGDDYLGIYSHEKCQEKCICNRKLCKNQIIHNLMCPKGYKENKKTCQCVSSKGESIFFRNMGIITNLTSDLHELCRNEATKHSVKVGESFTLYL